MIRYSPQAIRAIGLLKRPANDIEIYVEDISKATLWLAVVINCMPDGCNISSVTPLGSREDVIRECKADQALDGRKRIYIIDGDFDFILGKRKPRIPNLVRISAYCLENLLINYEGIAKIVYDLRPDFELENLLSDIVLDIEEGWGPILRRLFGLYALHHAVHGDQKTSSFHVSRLCKKDTRPWKPCKTLLREQSRKILTSASLAANRSLVIDYRILKSRAKALDLKKVVSGKTYLYPLLTNWLAMKAELKIDARQLEMLIVSRAPKMIDRSLAIALRSAFA